MNFLNNGAGYDLFEYEARKKSYVDKTLLIDAVYRYTKETASFASPAPVVSASPLPPT